MDRILLTAKGAIALRAELKKLKSEDRPNVIAAIAEARAHGDLSENAEYEAAREQQGFIEGRIKELDAQLSLAEVIDPTKLAGAGKVVFGSRVDLYDEEAESEVSYQIVGDLESDPDDGKISLSTPIAKAIIGKQVEDEVSVDTPGGTRRYEVLKISFDA